MGNFGEGNWLREVSAGEKKRKRKKVRGLQQATFPCSSDLIHGGGDK